MLLILRYTYIQTVKSPLEMERKHLLAVNPTHLAYGMTFLSQWEEARSIIVVVIQIQPTKIQTSASNHSGWRSGVKHTCGLLYIVIQVHIKPNRVSPIKKNELTTANYLKMCFYLPHQLWSNLAWLNLQWQRCLLP